LGAARPDRQDVTFHPLIEGNNGVNVLKPHLQTTIWTLLKGGATQREIERITSISRHTIRLYQRRFAADPANCPGVATDSPSQTAPPRPPTSAPIAPPPALSKCEPHRAFIDAQLRLGRNATAIYQDLVDLHGFEGAYNSVKRFCAQLRHKEPDSAIHGLIACDILTKGFDVPDVMIGVSARPYTKSLSAHIQQMGRVMRPSEGKTFALWLDHSGSGAGKSGGQRQKLTATVLAAALRYQLAGEEGVWPTYSTVVMDEAFDRADNEFTAMVMNIFKSFGFQVVAATPVKNVMALEPFIGGGTFVSIRDRKHSEALAITYVDQTGRLDLPLEAQEVLAEELAADATEAGEGAA
jgi:hypothetical protein